jgi:hypothetical protein
MIFNLIKIGTAFAYILVYKIHQPGMVTCYDNCKQRID